MEQLPPAYILSLAAQLASLSAFLGGFAATFLATLLTLGHKGRLMTLTIGFAVTSAMAFIVTVVAATMLTAIHHPDAPARMASGSSTLPQALMGAGFMIGTLSLLASLGCSGWTRSRSVGWITTVTSLVATILILAMTVQVS